MIHFNDKYVSDLFWLLSSPSPMRENSISDLPLLPTILQQAWHNEGIDFLKQLDKNPLPLHKFLNQRASFRLGIYAEYLLQYFFEYAPHIELLAHHVQLIKDKITLGEIDFVIQYQGKVMHIELAVKYYLQEGKDTSFADWIGPSGKDTLARKLKKVKEHQLPLINSPVFKTKYNFTEVHSFFWLRGMFFTNQPSISNWQNTQAKYGKYYRSSELDEVLYKDQEHFVILERPHWMMDILHVDQTAIRLPSYRNDQEILTKTLNVKGSLLIKNAKTEEVFFIVPDQWPLKTNTKKLDSL